MTHSQWIITADNRRATLFACQRLPGGGVHVDRLTSIENSHEGEHEHHRPDLLGGAERRGARGSSSAHAAPHSASEGHASEEEQRRFAREVGGWLAGARRQFGAETLTLFAPPRLLSLLREHVTDAKTNLREGELTHLRPQELAVHPTVLSAVTGA